MGVWLHKKIVWDIIVVVGDASSRLVWDIIVVVGGASSRSV